MAREEHKLFWPPGSFIRHLMDDREIQRRRPVENKGDFEIHSLDISPLKLNVNYYTPFLICKSFSAHNRLTAQQIEDFLPQLHEQVREAQSPFVVLVVGGVIEGESTIVRKMGDRSIAVISHDSIEATVNAKDREEAWRHLSSPLVRYLGHRQLSPYQPGRPAFGGRFFGRLEALNRATSGGKLGGNFTIMGNRRIGKTSLLREVKARLLRDNARLRTAEIYGNNFHSTEEVISELFVHLRPDLARRLPSEPRLIDNLPAHISFLPERQNEDVVVFIDELDHILEFDSRQGYRLLNLLRATFEHERCRIFFAGFRRVMDAKGKMDTPLFNFTQFIVLSSLTRNETHEMIVGPLSRLGIQVPPQLPDAIMRETSGHPELVQMFCAQVVEYFHLHNRVPSASDLVSTITADDIFRQTVYTTFLKNTNPAEKLLCYALIQRASQVEGGLEHFTFAIKDCDEVLKLTGLPSISHSELDGLTDNLKIGGVVAPVPGRPRTFQFAVPRLAEFCLAEDIDFIIRKAKEEVLTAPGPTSLLTEAE